MVKPILIKFADTSDLSKVFVIDDIFTFWLAISEIIRVKTPIVSPWQFIVDCVKFTQFSHCRLIIIMLPDAQFQIIEKPASDF